MKEKKIMQEKILFVCRGNVARSQIAMELFKKFTGLDADSAGTQVFDEENSKVGQVQSVQPVIRILKQEEGIDISKNIRHQITPEMVKKYDKIIIMSEPENTPDYLKNSRKTENWEYWKIQDPVKISEEDLKKIIFQIKSKVLEFIEKNFSTSSK